MTTASGVVARARGALLAALAASGVLWAVAGFCAVILLIVVIDLAAPLPYGVRVPAFAAAVLVSLLCAVAAWWRGRHARDPVRVALYLEERVPALSYALVTAVSAPGAHGADLERRIAAAPAGSVLRSSLLRALALPALAAAVLVLVLALLPAALRARVLDPHEGDVLSARTSRAPAASRLSPIVVRVYAPSYAASPPREEVDPPAVSALAGSRIEIEGAGARIAGFDSLRAELAGQVIEAVADGDRWTISLPLPSAPAALLLRDRGHERLLSLEPMPDLAPVVTLTSPLKDTTYIRPTGQIALAAEIQDDIGLASATFEVLHTSGTGERFRTGRQQLGAVTFGRVRTGRITGALRLDTMRLGPGDILHIRALATDRNDRTGPGRGASDTRTIRIIDTRRQDTVSLQLALEIPLDTSVLSQRALIIRAETLLRRERRLGPTAFRREAVDLGTRQRMLRERVQEVISEIETEGQDGPTTPDAAAPGAAPAPGTPVDPSTEHQHTETRLGTTVVSRLLGQAVSAMIDAELELGDGRVLGARPHMYRALRLLQQARDATARYYLRGPLPKVVIDIERARLRGRDTGNPNERLPREAQGAERRALLLRFDRAARVAEQSGAAAADSMTLLRLEALRFAPEAAAPLSEAASALRAGREAGAALRAARRSIERRTQSLGGIAEWQTAP